MELDRIHLHLSTHGLIALNVILALVMFGVALDVRPADFRRLLHAPRAALVGLGAQFVLLPAFTVLLAVIINPPPSIALGMILVAACPGGNVSNFITNLAGGNTALSIGMTGVSTTAAVIMTPLNLALWGSVLPKTSALLTHVAVSPVQMFGSIALLLGIPLAAGMTVASHWPRLAAKLHRPMRLASIALLLVFVGAALHANLSPLAHTWYFIFPIVIVHNATALAVGYGAARLARVSAYDARAISVEVGIQNSGLGLALVINFFGGLGGMALIAAAWGLWHIVSGMSLALFWSRRPVAPGSLTGSQSGTQWERVRA